MKSRVNGFTVLELMLALSLSALVLAGLLTVAHGVTDALRQVQALDLLSATARHVHAELATVTASAGSRAAPLRDPPMAAVGGSRTGAANDLLTLRTTSPRNCFGNDNPVRDPGGQPAWWLQHNEYTVRDGWRLVRSCFYGPPNGSLTRQLNAATLVEGVETLRLRFGLDTDGDRRLDRWTAAGGWDEERQILGVRAGLVLATEDPVGVRPTSALTLFGEAYPQPDDGRARIALVLTFPIRGRL